MSEVIKFPEPPAAPPLLVGPFTYNKVIVDGRAISKLDGRHNTDGTVSLIVDGRFEADFPSEAVAHQAAWLIAQGMAVSAGYAHLGAATKDHPFAPFCSALNLSDR